ncbi:MAG: type VI secretion system Vgr family protein [Deltaproteobacteria bacterium]
MALTRIRGNEARFLFGISGVKPELLVVRFELEEAVSVPFVLMVDLACEDEVKLDDALGKEGFLTLTGDGGDRIVHGVVDRFEHTGNRGRFGLYNARVVPYLRWLSLERDCRIFQNKSVPDIVKQILQESGLPADRFDFRLKESYPAVEYCVQYRETDLDFVSRLLEEEGIFYFFEHSDTKHLLVFADGTVAYREIPGESGVTYNFSQGLAPKEECVFRFSFSRQVRSGKMTRRDYNFEKPGLDLTKDEQAKVHEKLEVYDYPGRYAEPDRGKRLSQVRLQESMTYYEAAEGESTCVRLVPGFKFSLKDHERSEYDREYFLTRMSTRGEQPQSMQEAGGSGGGGFRFSNRFTAIPASVPFRPARVTPRPVVEGIQTATVTGPKGEEIYTDKYGRVKVRFHWDRAGVDDEKSSCWIRVASTFAGGQYGAIFTPRIGHEVVVDFLEGDPDRPLITGSVYNADRMPPYELPEEKTKSTTKTDSSLGGKGFNELRFEDKKGSEEVYLQGEKDWTILIKNNKDQTVGNCETLSVGVSRTKKVGADQSETIGANKTITVGQNHVETIGLNMSLEVGAAKTETVAVNSAETIGGAKELTIGGAYQVTVGAVMNETVGASKSEEVGISKKVIVGKQMTEDVGESKALSAGTDITETAGKIISLKAGDKVVVEAAEEMLFRTGDAQIAMKRNGDITIKGKKIQITGSGDVIIKGSKILQN